jgi:ribonuclease HI
VKVEIYSDGSSDGKSGGIGGWAFVIIVDGVKVHEDSGSEQKATNNTVELLGASKGLEYAASAYPQCDDVTLISDSQCVLRWATGEYQVKKPHLIPYVINLRKFFRQLNAKTRWERGHIGEPNNERADQLAKAAREQLPGHGENRDDQSNEVADSTPGQTGT